MSKTEEKQKKQSKKITERYFYQKWWFWVVIGVIFSGTWAFLFIKDMDLRSSIIGICGVWGSTIATIFIGIIAARQSERYAFISRKQNLIDIIRTEQTSFLSAYVEICDIGQYTDIVMKALFSTESEWDKKLECTIQYAELCLIIEDFFDKLTSFWYSPTGIKQMQDCCKDFLNFLKTDLNEEVLLNTPIEKAVETNKYLVHEYLQHMSKFRKAKNVSIVEMQYLVRIISQTKTMGDLKDIENKISGFNKENYKELFKANELKNQDEKEQEKND